MSDHGRMLPMCAASDRPTHAVMCNLGMSGMGNVIKCFHVAPIASLQGREEGSGK